jgi:uncharacterized membrane protein
MTTSQKPVEVPDGIAMVQVSWVEEVTLTLVAVIFVPECWSNTVTVPLVWKLFPVIVADIESPASPSSGSIPLKEGAEAEDVVVVATVAVVAVVTLVVGTVVGVFTGTADTETLVILTVYTFSRSFLDMVLVSEFNRYPQVPSEFW